MTSKTKRKFPAKEEKKKPVRKKAFSPKTWDEFEANGVEEPKDYAVDTSQPFPSPSPNKIFKARWDEYIGDITARENFKRGHLAQLEILCNLYVELAHLEKKIADKGYSYKTDGRNGVQWKVYPEVGQKNRTLSEIRSYSKTLGLLLVKDKQTNDENGEEKQWE